MWLVCRDEFAALAEWVDSHNLYSATNRYLIQVPRLYDTWKAMGSVTSFADILRNVFEPLFEATLNPNKNRIMTRFLSEVSGFDCVDDESKVLTSHATVRKHEPDWCCAVGLATRGCQCAAVRPPQLDRTR